MTVMQIKKLDNYGRGITYYNDAIMFVDNAIPNEKITVKNITKKKKFYGKITKSNCTIRICIS